MKRKARSGPGTLEGSPDAKRCAHAILEVLSGLKGPSEAAQALSVSVPRYYVLETRALEGMVKGLEPRGKGKRRAPSVESRLQEVETERDRLKVELERARSLVRAANRTVGLPSAKEKKGEEKTPGKKGRKPRKVNRTRRVLSRLAAEGGGGRGKRGPGEDAGGAETSPPDAGGVEAEPVPRGA